MPTPDRDAVQEILARNDRDLKIRAAIGQAWSDVQAKYPDRAWWRRGEGEVILFPVAPKLPAGETVVRPIVPDIGETGDKEV